MYEGRWVTINGTHVFIVPSGKITKGPNHLIGKNYRDIPKNTVQRSAPKEDEVTITTTKDYGEAVNKYLQDLKTAKNRSEIASILYFPLKDAGFSPAYIKDEVIKGGKVVSKRVYTEIRDKDGNVVAKINGAH